MKKQFLLLNIILVVSINLYAQVAIKPEATCCTKETTALTDPIQQEKLEKELQLFTAYLEKEIAYPEQAQTYNVEGRVVVRVSFDGAIKAFKITKSLNPACDKLVEEKIRAYVEQLDKKAYQNMPEITFQIPVDFQLVDF